MRRESGSSHVAQRANDAQGNKFSFNLSKNGRNSSRFASEAEHTACPISRHDLGSGPNAKTFTITGKKESRVFKVTDKTSISKSGKAATMKDITENEEASGSYWKNADGTLEAKTVKLGPMGAGAKKGKSPPAAFPITSPEPKP